MRKALKISHTLAACGLIGGLLCHMILLAFAPQDTPAAYADLRQSIAAIGAYVLMPSLMVVLVSGLLSMIVHTPFLNMGWALIKAVMGILMFKGVLVVVIGKSDHAAVLSTRVADGDPVADLLAAAIAQEWTALGVVMALSVVNVLLGIWRPTRLRFWPSGAGRGRDSAAVEARPPAP